MSIKEILLNKGWAGRTISRAETVDQLNPHIQAMSNLLYAYNLMEDNDIDSFDEASMGEHIRVLRMDIGKMSETIASCGGISLRSPERSLVGESTEWSNIIASEKALQKMILAEQEIEHQMRTRAILSKIAENTDLRIQQLSRLVQK